MYNNEPLIRHVEIEDSYDLLETMKKIDSESYFMLRNPGERKTTLEEQVNTVSHILSQRNKTILLATIGNSIVGYLICLGGSFEMTQYSASVIMGILDKYINQGIGTMLFENLDSWAALVGIHRLELRVDEKNDIALHLYKKIGFSVDGIAKESVFVKGEFRNVYMMSKILK